MYLIIFGAPGVGKGTQAKRMSEKNNIPQISTGDMLRAAIDGKTEIGNKAAAIMAEGKLVPDDIILEMIKERFSQNDCSHGFILDGFPRTIVQAGGLDKLKEELNLPPLLCIEICVPAEAIIERLINRRHCEKCHTDYNLLTNPPQESMICTKCGGNVVKRHDDNRETISNRLQVYQQQTAPLRDYYIEQGIYHEVQGSTSVEEVQKAIFRILKS